VKRVEDTIVSILVGNLSHGVDNSRRSTLNLIDITQMISHKPFGPHVLLPVFEKQERVKMNQHSRVTITHQMKDLCLLKLVIVNTQVFPVSHGLHQTVEGRSIYGGGLVHEFVVPFVHVYARHISGNFIQTLLSLDIIGLGSEGSHALLIVPWRRKPDHSSPRIEFLGLFAFRAVPISTVVRGKQRIASLIDNMTTHDFTV
jgi:hypothetical protein